MPLLSTVRMKQIMTLVQDVYPEATWFRTANHITIECNETHVILMEDMDGELTNAMVADAVIALIEDAERAR